MTIGLIACCATKQENECYAKDMYISPLFRMSREWIEKQGVPWFILSAKYGLLNPEQKIEPYNLTLSQLTRQQRQQWASYVRRQIDKSIGNQPLLVLAGTLYLEATRGHVVIDPLKGLPIGKRLQKLKKMLK